MALFVKLCHSSKHQMAKDHALYTWIVSGSIIAGFYILFFLLKKWSGTRQRFIPSLVQKYLHLPGLVLCILIAGDFIAGRLALHYGHYLLYAYAIHLLDICVIIAVGFLAIRVIRLLYELLVHHQAERDQTDFTLRSVRTKFLMIQRILNIVVVIGTVSAILMTFDQVRQFGTTLLASAGMAGIVLGFAAQKSLGTLFTGIQIAISQPVKIGDVVVIEGQYGTIGEITLTYIVVDAWDEKRLVVPINYFLEHSFENWTRQSPEVMAQVKFRMDYMIPLEDLRADFMKWLGETPLWDRRKSSLLVIDVIDKTMQVSAVMSARNSYDAFKLECLVREKLIGYVRKMQNGSLP
jgi:small-conductance mechanosensitive channel